MLYLVIIILGIYFIVKTIKFMEMKQKLDQERNEKIDQLIQLIHQNKNDNM